MTDKILWPKRWTRSGETRRHKICKGHRTYRITESRPPGLSRVFYAERRDPETGWWLPASRPTGKAAGPIARHRTEAAAKRAIQATHRCQTTATRQTAKA